MLKDMLKSIRQKYKSAFTLIETLVAIAILVTSITAPLTIAANSWFHSRYARDQVVATYLAQEAIEMVRYIRDRNLMKQQGSRTAEWLEFIPKDAWFSPDWETSQSGSIVVCPNPADPTSCPYLKYLGAYTLNNGDTSKFKRAVRVTTNSAFPDEVEVESIVYWVSGVTGERSISVKTRLYNWAIVEQQ